jgi:hypothetical protein
LQLCCVASDWQVSSVQRLRKTGLVLLLLLLPHWVLLAYRCTLLPAAAAAAAAAAAVQRDVPGLTRAVIPILAAKGIKAVSVGVNPGAPGFSLL